MKLLIIEDEKELSDGIASYLERDDYLCEQAFDFDDAMMRVNAYEYDCVLLDLMLPGGNGLDVLRTLKRQKPQTGVIIVSAKGSLDDKLDGLKIGADDYIAKPFHLAELRMRIFALLRRKNITTASTMQGGRVKVDFSNKKASVDETTLDLTKSEYELLLFLMENHHRVVSKSAIAEHLSGDMADMLDDFNFVYAHIKNLKCKLADAGVKDCIKNYYGMGYKWEEEE